MTLPFYLLWQEAAFGESIGRITSSSLLDLASQTPSANVIVFMEGSTKDQASSLSGFITYSAKDWIAATRGVPGTA